MIGRFLCAALALAIPLTVEAADLTVTLSGIRSGRGFLQVSLFRDPASWPDGTPTREERVPAGQGVVTLVVAGLAPGRYVLAGYHDENANGTIDKNFLGIPSEGYFLGNDAKPFLSAPAFDAVAVLVAPDGSATAATLRY